MTNHWAGHTIRPPRARPGAFVQERPFRTVLPPPIAQLLQGYNEMAEGIRPIVAGIFNVPELVGGRSVGTPA